MIPVFFLNTYVLRIILILVPNQFLRLGGDFYLPNLPTKSKPTPLEKSESYV